MKQKAFVVSYVPNRAKDTTEGLDELNKLLDAGWAVGSVHPMSAAATGGDHQTDKAVAFAALVIVHDQKEAPKAPLPITTRGGVMDG